MGLMKSIFQFIPLGPFNRRCKELLEGLKNKYPLGIISNGFPLTQDKKVEKSM